MKKLGIIGGIGPESTVEYYKRLIYGYREITKDENYPRIFINSINMTEVLDCLANNNLEALIDLLENEIKKLEIIGAECIAIASNTPHCVIDKLIQKTKTPIINIVEETSKFINNNNLKKVLLTGTIFTMERDFYKKSLEEFNIDCVVPDEIDRHKIQNIIFPNLENGIVLEQDKIVFKDICNKIIKEQNIDGLILGCTELPLMVNQNDFDVKVIDTMEIHIKGILEAISSI